MAIVQETIRVVVSATSANPQTIFYTVPVDTTTGAGQNPVAISYTGANPGSDTIQAFMDSHSLSSNTSAIVWQGTNGNVAVGPVTLNVYANNNKTTGYLGLLTGAGDNGRTFPYLNAAPGANSLVWNQVSQTYPVTGMPCLTTNISSCGGGYKTFPILVVNDTATGAFSQFVTIAGTNNFVDNGGNRPGEVISATSSLVVKQSGWYTFYMVFANVSSCAVWIGGGATFASQNGASSGNGGNAGGNSSGNTFPGTSPVKGYPLAIAATNPTAIAHPNTVSSYVYFPKPGVYGIEVYYNQFFGVQFSGDNNGFWQLTYVQGQQNQAVGNTSGSGLGNQNLPVTLLAAPATGATPTGQLRLTPTGGAANLLVQGSASNLTLTVQNVTYSSIPYVPILEGTAGHMEITNSGANFNFQTYNGAPVNTTAAASSVFSIGGANTSGLFNVTATGAAPAPFQLNYTGAAFSFLTPSSQIPSTNLSITANDIAWFDSADNSFDLFSPVGGAGGISYAVDVDFMTRPSVQSVSPASLVALATHTQAVTINLNKPMSPMQQGQYGTGNTLNVTASFSAGVTNSTLVPILNGGYLQGWTTNVTVPTSTSNGSTQLTLNVSGTLTYLSGGAFTTGTVTYISGVVATIPITGSQYVNPTNVSLAVSPTSTSISSTSPTVLTATVYSFDNSPITCTFYYKYIAGASSGTQVTLGSTSTPATSYTGTVSGKTAYYKTFTNSHTYSTVDVTSALDVEVNFGFATLDTTSGLNGNPNPYFNTTTYFLPFTIITVCFSGNVGVQTPNGFFAFQDLPREGVFDIKNETGVYKAKLITHEYEGWMLEFAPDKYVTLDHKMKRGKDWVNAEECFPNAKRFWYVGTVYNMHVFTENYEDEHYILDTGDIAHNKAEICFSPNTLIKTQRGDVKITEIIEGKDKVLTARGTWKTVAFVTTRRWYGPMLDMGDGELSTPTHLVKHESAWKPMNQADYGFPTVDYDGTIHNIHINCDLNDDGTGLDTEHSYTLANGLVVHNISTA